MLLTQRHLIGISSSILGFCAAYHYSVVPSFLVCTAIAYAAGFLPATYFPPPFAFMYTAYCSTMIGSRIKGALHVPSSFPHSNYRSGCRLLGPAHEKEAFGEAAITLFLDTIAVNSENAVKTAMTLVVPVPMFADNYAFVCFSIPSYTCCVVDPADASATLRMIKHISALALKRNEGTSSFRLTHVLCTHKHWDHAGGNLDLLDLAQGKRDRLDSSFCALSEYVSPNLEVFGSTIDRPQATTHFLNDKDRFDLCNGQLRATALASPGHTEGSLLFLITENQGFLHPSGSYAERSRERHALALFTGDCIFCGGCGAMFETKNIHSVLKSYDVFHNDLVVCDRGDGIKENSQNVWVYCGHEYSERLFEEFYGTVKKLSMDKKVQWSRQFADALKSEYERIQGLRSLRQYKGDSGTVMLPYCTLPSTLQVERSVNPLLSLRREALVRLAKKNVSNLAEIEKVIYTSNERII